MKRDSKMETVAFLGSALGAAAVLGLLIYRNEELKKQATHQIAQFMNASGRLLAVYVKEADKIVAAHMSSRDQEQTLQSQWSEVEKAQTSTQK